MPSGYPSNFPVGPWSERRNTLQFTGDTPATWDMLAYETRFTADEAAAGLSNVSHDIGSFHGGHLADDLYARWMQFGVFQPVDRMHSDHGDRLPWNYTGAAAASAESSLRLREALVPYTYTLAQQANTTGVPIVRPMYLDYPTQNAAYTATGEYLYGPDVLVAPITSPNDANGNGSASVWVPPGSWTDYFTGRTYTGPAIVTITDPLSQLPVLIKGGGIMPTRTDYVDHQGQSALTKLTVNVAAGCRRHLLALLRRRRGQRLQGRQVHLRAAVLERGRAHSDHRRPERRLHRRPDLPRVHAAAVELRGAHRRLGRRRPGARDRLVLERQPPHRHRHHRRTTPRLGPHRGTDRQRERQPGLR